MLKRRSVPVWITGHSLGGGYAAALFLHLLTLRQFGTLFPAGKPAYPSKHAHPVQPWCLLCTR